MPQLHIRPAALIDLPAITAIYRHAVLHGTATFELDPPDLAEMTRRYEALAAAGFPYLVAVMEDPTGPVRPIGSQSKTPCISILRRRDGASGRG